MGGEGLEVWQEILLVFFYITLYVGQVFLQSETVIVCTSVLALPPYVDKENAGLIKAVAAVNLHAETNDFKKAAKALGLPIDLIKEKLLHDYNANRDSAP